MTSVSLENAVEAKDIVWVLRQYGITQDDVASVADVSTRAVRGWKESSPRLETYDRLSELRALVVLLTDSLTPRGVGQWLHARNRMLKEERPIDLLSRGESAKVERAARAFVEGSYV